MILVISGTKARDQSEIYFQFAAIQMQRGIYFNRGITYQFNVVTLTANIRLHCPFAPSKGSSTLSLKFDSICSQFHPLTLPRLKLRNVTVRNAIKESVRQSR